MADLSTMVEYDKTYPVALKDAAGKDIGVVFNVVSSDAERVVKALRKLEADRWASGAVGEEFDFAEYIAKQERVRLVAAIDSWDWGDNTFGGIDLSVCDGETKSKVINHPNAKWIRDQLSMGAANIENFMHALSPGVPNTSVKM